LTRFLRANRYPPRIKSGAGFRWKTLRIATDRDEAAMAQEFSRRSIAGFAVAMVVATVLTVMGTFYVLHRFVLDNPADPLTRAGGLRPDQTAK
jgi:hypothetical protein